MRDSSLPAEKSAEMMAGISTERSAEFQVAGAMLVGFSLVIIYGIYFR
jgi:hypothetical protein